MGFKADLKIGNDFENLMIEKLKKDNDIIVKAPECPFSKYDFMINDIKYECKVDRLAHRTGNLCIEYKCRGKRSGIKTTESDYYIIKVNNIIFLIPVIELKNYIKQNKQNIKKVLGGDNKSSKLYLLKLDLFNKYMML